MPDAECPTSSGNDEATTKLCCSSAAPAVQQQLSVCAFSLWAFRVFVGLVVAGAVQGPRARLLGRCCIV